MIHILGRRLGVAAAVLAGVFMAAPAAQAALVFSNGFNSENGGAPVANHTPGGFTVVSGSVDLLRHGASGVSCAGGFGQCIDLEGSLGYGLIRLETGHAFAVKAGDQVTLSFDMSGNQRSEFPTNDGFFAGFLFSKALDLSVTLTGVTTTVFDMPAPAISYTQGWDVPSNAGFSNYSLSFIAPEAFDLRFRFGARAATQGGGPSDGLGPLLDNVKLDITSAPAVVPEPATWAMMLTGFGALGAVLRRRRAAYA